MGWATGWQVVLIYTMLCVKSLQSCLTLCDPMDCSPPGSSVHEVLQARIREWVSHVLFQGIFPHPGIKPTSLRSLHWQVSSLPLVPPGKPCVCVYTHTYMYICVYVCVYTHIYVYMCVCVCINFIICQGNFSDCNQMSTL